jgi:3'(2'), 5'-bisphosphate nucleotidase
MLDLKPIMDAARQAADLCSEVQRKYLERTDKAGKEPVTIADYGSQAIICRTISQVYPDDGVLAEEQGKEFVELVSQEQRDQIVELLAEVLGENVTEEMVVGWLDHGKNRDAAQTWVIDPIDGTKGFIALRHYAVAVGLVQGRDPIGAVMVTPGYGDSAGAMFYAQDGKAYQQSMNGDGVKPIGVSQRQAVSEIRVVQSVEKAHGSKSRMQLVREHAGLEDATLVELDSMEKYALVANGEADLYLRLPRAGSDYAHKAWDHAAGAALVLAAGGKVTDVDGSPLDFSTGRMLPNMGMVVSNGAIHDRVLQAVQEVLAE